MDKAHKATDDMLEAMERELAAIYREAQKGISDKAAAYFEQFQRLDEKKKSLVADGKLSEDEYLQWRKNKILYSNRFVTLQGQITGELARVNQTAAAYINDQLPDVYALNYNYVGKGVQRAVKGYSFTLIDANTVKRLATKTDGLLPERKVDVPKDKLWNAKKMRAQVLQGILQGESMDKIADRMQTVTDMNGVSAIRNARTMVTGAENAGRIDMMHKAATDGVIMRKLWIATTDSRTRDWHRDLDGKEADIDEPFQNDFGDIMFPGDPTADGANVYNCRCALGYRVVGFGKAQVEKAMAEKQAETYSTFADGEQASKFFGERPPRSLRRENRGEYDRLREEYRQSSFGSWYEGLSGEETTSIAEYSGDAYSGINGLLRGHMTEKMVKAWDDVSSMGIREMIDHIDDSISRFELKNGIKVYRTCEKDVFESLSTQVGSKFVDDGFVSTTVLNKKVASGNVFMEIDVPPGTGRGAWINPLSGSADEEWEFLLQRGSVFEITDVSDVGDDIVVKMKWTGIEKKDIKFASREDVIAWQKRNGLYDETEEYRI